ncbi:MAG: peptidylprolyl isomerase, partial [Mucinivorans sp.]
DFNHPMAGKTLNFSGSVVAVRDSTEEDAAKFFASSGEGCSCGSDCSCTDDCNCSNEDGADCGSQGCKC